MLFLNFDQYQQYSTMQNMIALSIVGVAFILLGWLVTKLLRPSNRLAYKELHTIKKELIDELNNAKKFNADYHLLIERGEPTGESEGEQKEERPANQNEPV